MTIPMVEYLIDRYAKKSGKNFNGRNEEDARTVSGV